MKVLLIDDHALFREGLGLLLKPAFPDLVTWEAGDCASAFALIASSGLPELVLIDLSMPGMHGIDGIGLLRSQHPELPIVALSSADDRDTVLRAIDAGAMGFIPKSATSAILLAALQVVFAKGIYLPATVLQSAPAVPVAAVEPAASASAAVHADAGHRHPASLGLTSRQADVLYRILQGKPAKLICRELDLSASTVKAHTSAVLRALNVTTRTQAVIAASRLGLRFDDR